MRAKLHGPVSPREINVQFFFFFFQRARGKVIISGRDQSPAANVEEDDGGFALCSLRSEERGKDGDIVANFRHSQEFTQCSSLNFSNSITPRPTLGC